MTHEPSRALARRFQETGSADDAVGAFLALAREGLRAEATLLLDEAMARGLPVDEILDSLTPGPLESIVPGALSQRGEGELWNAAWAPDERSLYVVQDATIVRWTLDQGPQLLVDRDRIHAHAQSSLGAVTDASHLAVGESLVLDAAGKRLAFTVRVRSWSACFVLDIGSDTIHVGPSGRRPTGTPRAWWGDHLIFVREDSSSLHAWRMGSPPSLNRFASGSISADASRGTCVTRTGPEVDFHRPIESERSGRQTVPGWRFLHAAWGGRTLLLEPDQSDGSWHVALLDVRRNLVETNFSGTRRRGSIGELVCPCPSGWVVALLIERHIILVDLRTHRRRDIELEYRPLGACWSPSGKALALPGTDGVLQVLDGGLGLEMKPMPSKPTPLYAAEERRCYRCFGRYEESVEGYDGEDLVETCLRCGYWGRTQRYSGHFDSGFLD